MANLQGTKHREKQDGKLKRTRLDLRVWHKYRISLSEYENLLSKGCFICGSKDDLCIDHDHNCCPTKDTKTGKSLQKTCGKCIRGVLCRRHNLAEGHLNSDPGEVRKLLEYLTTKI